MREIILIKIAILLIIGTGWIMNILKLVDCDFEKPYKCEILHGIGLVPPIGMVTGWINTPE